MEIHNLFSSGSSLTWPDYAVVLVLLALLIFVGIYSGREEKSTNDFFLGGRKIPWWAACLSFVATEISAVTLICGARHRLYGKLGICPVFYRLFSGPDRHRLSVYPGFLPL